MAQLIPQNFFKGSTRRINMVSFRDRPICPCGDFPWKGYYWERQPPKNYDFEQNYWQQPVDPDGNKRTPMQERKKKLLEDEGFTILKIEHPFFDTEHFTKENLLRLFNGNKTSPPFYGNTVTIYAIKD